MKQIIIALENKELVVPVAYQQALQGIVYMLISEGNSYLASIVHNGEISDAFSFKLFTFSGIRGNAKYNKKKLIFTGDVTFEIRSAEDGIIDAIEQALLRNQSVQIINQIRPVRYYRIGSTNFASDRLLVKVETGIDAHDNFDGYSVSYEPSEDMFIERVCDNAIRKYLSWSGAKSVPMFMIQPVSVKKTDKVVTTFKGIYITAYRGIYEIRGTPELLTFLYYTGLGSRNSQGFGMFELV